MINNLFNWCVNVLLHLESITGISYEALNIYLFVFLNPGLLVLSIIYIIILLYKIKKLKQKLIEINRN